MKPEPERSRVTISRRLKLMSPWGGWLSGAAGLAERAHWRIVSPAMWRIASPALARRHPLHAPKQVSVQNLVDIP